MSELIKRSITFLILVLVAAVIWIYFPVWVASVVLALILIYILLFEWPQFKLWWLTPFYPVLPFVLLILLNHLSVRELLLFLGLVICAHDSGAYFVGKLMGKHKIMPTISPGKTWQGFWGGYVVSLIVGMLFVWVTHIKLRFWSLPVTILLLNGAGLAGDLFESYLKRRIGIKDSGRILPGHGGLLDRFDSILFAVVVFSLMIML